MKPPGEEIEPGRFKVDIETIWSKVKAWAKRKGHKWDGSYGVVNVAAC